MPKKSDAVAINRNEESDDSDDDVDIVKNTRKKKTPTYRFGHSCKLSILMFVAFILIMSDVFVERVMAKTKMGLVLGRTPTKKGICAQGVILVLSLIVLDFLISKEKI
jgi:short subunit fatty acids transporter